jgi:hypothetical protein
MTELIGRKFWDITPLFEGKPPVPKKKIVYPICGCDVIWFKQAVAFKRREGQYRVDIVVKCNDCALVGPPERQNKAGYWNGIPFGVHITEEEYETLCRKGLQRIEYTQTGHVNLNSLVRE